MKSKPEFKTAEMWEAYISAKRDFEEYAQQCPEDIYMRGIPRNVIDLYFDKLELKNQLQEKWNSRLCTS